MRRRSLLIVVFFFLFTGNVLNAATLHDFSDISEYEGQSIGRISDMECGRGLYTVYALDRDNGLLYVIDTSTEKISSAIELPYGSPISMSYSPEDDKLYIAYISYTTLTVYDTKTWTYYEISYSEDSLSGFNPEKVVLVAPNLNKIFLISHTASGSNRLITIDKTTEKILFDQSLNTEIINYDAGFYDMAVIEENKTLVISNDVTDTYEIWKLSIKDDGAVELLQKSNRENSRGIGVIATPDGSHLANFTSWPENAVLDLDLNDLDIDKGKWKPQYDDNRSYFIEKAEFSNNGDYIHVYVDQTFACVFTFSSSSYREVQRTEMWSGNNIEMVANRAGDKGVVSNTYNYNNDKSRFQFFKANGYGGGTNDGGSTGGGAIDGGSLGDDTADGGTSGENPINDGWSNEGANNGGASGGGTTGGGSSSNTDDSSSGCFISILSRLLP